MSYRTYVLMFIFMTSKGVSDCSTINSSEYRLYDNLFSNYNPQLRPRQDPTQHVEVELEFELNTVSGVDEVNQVMHTSGFIVSTWYDDFLQWDTEEYENLTNFVVPAERVWLPDCGLQNSAKAFYDSNYWEDFRVDIRYTGRIIWKFGGNFATSCTLDMTYYPFDMQKCDIIVENWSYTSKAVELTKLIDDVHLQEYSENGEWSLDHSNVTVDYYTEGSHPGVHFPRVTFSIYITRKTRYYFINIILPALFVIAIALMVFWLPPDSGEKVSLGVTVLLAFSVFQLVIMEHTPKSSDFTPVLTLLFTIIMGAATFSVLSSILVLYYHHHGAESRPPKFIRFIAFRVLARLLCMSKQSPVDSINKVEPATKEDEKFMVSNKDENDINIILENMNRYEEEKTKIYQLHAMDNVHDTCPSVEYLRQILRYIKEMRDKMAEKDAKEEILNEWKFVAVVIDRSFFWLSSIVLIVSLSMMLFTRDRSH